MALIHLDKDEEIPFIPESEKKTDKPLTIYVKYMPHSVYSDYMSEMHDELNKNKSEINSRAIVARHDKKLFFKQVTRVENYLDSNGNQITDLVKFYEQIDFGLHAEIIATIKSHARLSEIQRKNSEGG